VARDVAGAHVGVVTFPGSLDDRDALNTVAFMGGTGVPLWHASRDLQGVDAVILPGGFSYGDYLRCGAIAGKAAIMQDIVRFAEGGGPVLGICNGFQILCESGLLPGALIRNQTLRFICKDVWLRIESSQTAVTAGMEPGELIEVPIKHGEGQFVATPDQLSMIEEEGRVVFRYATAAGLVDEGANPNGSVGNIAGVRNDRGNVVGLMPHPEHAVDPDVGPTGGQAMFASLLATAMEAVSR
jgi:phosphoribosylformylglycinamidine synthase subunit PurQ / glutaminase